MKDIIIDNTFGEDVSSKGMLKKWEGKIDGKKIYIKAGLYNRGAYSKIQPLTEVLVSDILQFLKVDHVKYYYNPKQERNGKYYEVCYSYDFATNGEFISMRHLVNRGEDDYKIVTSTFKEYREVIDTMIVVDFLINNIDRHYRNFGLVKSNDLYRFAPLFDHGFSLYGDLEDYELNLDDKETLEMIDECKTFKTSHYDQLDLIQSNIKINVKKEDIFDIVYKYKDVFTPHRIECIEHLISVRYNELERRGIFYV